jgi:WD40 repeat protein/serine/threonine protein kinase
MQSDETLLPGASAGAAPDAAGTQVGAYTLVEELGEGGFGTVWLAERRFPFVQRVALKVVKAGKESKEVIARFEGERQALAVMNHPNVARVFDGGITPAGRPYFAMEFVRGSSITQFCDVNRLSVRERLAIFLQVCDAVQHAHTKGIIHRDLKPSNVLVSMGEDDRPAAKVIDFGVAKALAVPLTDRPVVTEAFQLIGTPEYMSPEQAEPGQTDVDTRADVYSLGVLLYELLSGALPFESSELRSRALGEMRRVIREEDPPSPSARLSTIATKDAALATRIGQARQAAVGTLASLLRNELEWIPLKAMRKDRRDRYGSATDLARDVQRYLAGLPLSAGPETALYRVRKYVRRNRGLVAAASTVLAALVLGLGLAAWQYARANAALRQAIASRAVAESERDRARAMLGVMTLSKAVDAVRRNDPVATALELRAVAEQGLETRFAARLATALSAQSIAPPFEGHRDAVHAVAANPAGTLIASISGDGVIRRWDPHARRPLGDPIDMGDGAGGWSVAFSADGRTIFSGSGDGTVRAWDAATGEPRGGPMRGDRGAVRGIAASPDGKLIASASADGSVRLWDAESSMPVGTPLAGHVAAATSVCFSADGGMVASGSYDGTVRIWDAGSGRPIGDALRGHGDCVFAVAFSPDGRIVASASRDMTVRRWSIADGREVDEPMVGHANWVTSLAYSPDGTKIATGSYDNTVRLWDARTGNALGEPYRGHRRAVTCLAFLADGTTLATGSYDTTVMLWDVEPSRELGEPLAGHENEVRRVAFSPDGTLLATAGRDRTVRLWDLDTAAQRGVALRGHLLGVNGVDFSPDGRSIASASSDGTVRLWDPAESTMIGIPIEAHGQSVTDVAFSPDGALLATASVDRTVRLWDARSRAAVREPMIGHDDAVSDVCFSPDGSLLATASYDRTVRLWEVGSGRPVGGPLAGHADSVTAVAFSPDGTLLASASRDTTIRLWDVKAGRQLGQPLEGHGNGVFSVAFSPDGTTLASGAWDSTVRMWDVATARQIGGPMEGLENGFLSVAFAAGGEALAAGSTAGTVRLWNATPYEARHPRIRVRRQEASIVREAIRARESSVGDPADGVARLSAAVLADPRFAGALRPAALDVIARIDLERQAARALARPRQLRSLEEARRSGDVAGALRILAETPMDDVPSLDASFWNEIAWRAMAEVPADAPGREPRRVLAYALRANALSGGRDAGILDTLARALWEVDDRSAAIRFQRAAVASFEDRIAQGAGNGPSPEDLQVLTELRDTLARYEASRPAADGP